MRMPKVALADTLLEWESLLAAVEEHGTGLPVLKEAAEELKAHLEQMKALVNLRVKLQADLQKATQDLDVSRDLGQQRTVRIRSLVKAAFGTSWEGLVQFGVRPRRRRPPSLANRTALLTPLVEPGIAGAPAPDR
jgi:hypothetical protein